MADSPPEPGPAPPRRLWRRRMLHAGLESVAVAALVVVVGTVGIYGARREIARELAEAWLADHGVESRIKIERVDATGFVGRLRLGTDADPVLVADRIEVDFDLNPFWADEPFDLSARRIRLVRPRARLIYDGERLSLGQLDPLIEDLLSRPKTDKPAPDILIEDAQVRLLSPYGLLTLSGDAEMDEGKLVRVTAEALPAELKSGDLSGKLTGGRLNVVGDGEAVDAELALDFDAVRGPGLSAPDLDARLTLDDLRYELTGGLSATAKGSLQLSSGEATIGGARFGRPSVDLRLSAIEAKVLGGGVSGTLDGTAAFKAARVSSGDLSARDVRLDSDLQGASWSVSEGKLAARSRLAGRLQTGALAQRGADFNVSRTSARYTGQLAIGGEGPVLALQGSLEGRGGMNRPAARKLAEALPQDASGAGYGPALERALTDVAFSARAFSLSLGERTSLTFGAPIELASASGARATLSLPRSANLASGRVSGALALNVSGGGLPPLTLRSTGFNFADGVFEGQLALSTGLDIGPAEGARIDGEGRVRVGGGRVSFTASRCIAIAADRLRLGETLIEAPSAQACPSEAGPLFVSDQRGWRLDVRVQQAKAAIPALEVRVDESSGDLSAAGGEGRDTTVDLALADGQLTDLAEATRFHPVRASGPIELREGIWDGDILIRADKGEIGRIALHHDAESGEGRAEVDATRLVFAENGLQPSDVTPLVPFIRSVSGPAAFTGVFTWTQTEAPTGRGRLSTPGLDMRLQGFTVVQIRTDLELTSLTPLVTAPDQVITARLVQTLTEFEEARAVFDLTAGELRLDAMAVKGLGGALRLDAMVLPLDEARTVQGAIVLESVELGELLALSNLGDKIQAQASLDGRLPFEFGPEGFKFLEGEVHAREPGRLSIKREALTGLAAQEAAAEAPVSAVEDFAYQAMENLAFEELSANVKSEGGRLLVLFRIKGEHDPEEDQEIRVGIRELLSGRALQRRLPLPKGTPIDLTLDTSLNFDELLQAYRDAFRPE